MIQNEVLSYNTKTNSWIYYNESDAAVRTGRFSLPELPQNVRR